ncbi:MAG: hypothetical protein IJA62_07460 [Ruminococcus sp.]|nr:hypothetical protein [Ruminococcus sp.]
MIIENLPHQKGEYVVYKKQGIYLISDVRQDSICGVKKCFYVLRSVYDANAAVYVPADCDALVSQMEKVLTMAQIDGIIEESVHRNIEWEADSTLRQEMFQGVLTSGYLSNVIAFAKLLSARKEECRQCKKKMPALDERTLSAACKILDEAFAFSLGLEKKDVMSYITEKLSADF